MKTKKEFVFLAVFFVSIGCLFGGQFYILKSPEIKIEKQFDGYDAVWFKDEPSHYVAPGYPELPCRVFRYAVPADAIPDTIKVEFQVRSAGSLGVYEIKEVPAWVALDGTPNPSDQKKDRLFDHDAYWPRECVEYVGFSRMRKWNIIGVRFSPLQYNPRTKDLRFISEVGVTISYLQNGRPEFSLQEMQQDSVMDERAARSLANFQESAPWYGTSLSQVENQGPPTGIHNYVVITSNRIKNNSKQLKKFMDYLQYYRAFKPLMITEDDYGSLYGQAPNGRAEKIRQWLKTYYLTYGIKYVFLIGDPSPSSGDVPMKMFWPRLHDTYPDSPTDYFYADLTGNWDLNGDHYFGSILDQGGMDFLPEVYVGRIPVYSSIDSLDKILNKTIRYAVSPDYSWRYSCLLPASMPFFGYDGAYWAEAIKNDFLVPANFSYTRMYHKGSVHPQFNSVFPCEFELRSGQVPVIWSSNPRSCGLVFWDGHGSATHAVLGTEKTNLGTLMCTSDTASLNDNYPSVVFQNSCNNGYPERVDNLGTALLQNGAVATVSASRVSWAKTENFSGRWKWDHTNSSIGYCFAESVIANRGHPDYGFAQALFDAKDFAPFEDRGADGRILWQNAFDFNLYGDPSLYLGAWGLGAITITSPNGGESLVANTQQTIRWTSDCDPGSIMTIEYSEDNGATWKIQAINIPNTGSYDWTIPQGINSDLCLVRVRLDNMYFPYDASDSAFKIFSDTPPTVEITSPQNNANVYGSTEIAANATDDFGVSKVEFYLNDAKVTDDADAPYGFFWDALAVDNGTYTIKAIAYDTRNQASAPFAIEVNVKNILIGLSVSRETEKAWMVKKEYAKLSASINNPAAIPGVKYTLYRSRNGSPFEVLKEVNASEIANGLWTFIDKNLDKSIGYAYRIDAVDSYGKLAGKSAVKNI